MHRPFHLLSSALLLLALGSAAPEVAAQSGTIPYDDCGFIVEGVTCPMLFSDDDGRLWLLDDFGSTQVGDRVRVIGDADQGCITICQEGNGCIYNNTISECGSVGDSYCISLPNSTGSAALISAEGSESVSFEDLTLSATPVPPSQPGLFFFGPNQVQIPFGNGFRCVGGQLYRFPVITPTGMTMTFSVDFSVSPGTQLVGGTTWNFQAWFRDPAGGGSAFNLSDGLEVTFTP